MFNIVKNEDFFIEDEHYLIEDEHYNVNFFGFIFIINIVNENIVYRKLIMRSIECFSFEIIINNVFLMCLKLV